MPWWNSYLPFTKREPDDGWVMVDGELFDAEVVVPAVGELHYQAALRRVCGSYRGEDVQCQVGAVLVPEPDYRRDGIAVRVEVGGDTVGYLSGGDAQGYAPLFWQLLEEGKVGLCSARICGKADGEYTHTQNLGIFLDMPAVSSVLAQLGEEARSLGFRPFRALEISRGPLAHGRQHYSTTQRYLHHRPWPEDA